MFTHRNLLVNRIAVVSRIEKRSKFSFTAVRFESRRIIGNRKLRAFREIRNRGFKTRLITVSI